MKLEIKYCRIERKASQADDFSWDLLTDNLNHFDVVTSKLKAVVISVWRKDRICAIQIGNKYFSSVTNLIQESICFTMFNYTKLVKSWAGGVSFLDKLLFGIRL